MSADPSASSQNIDYRSTLSVTRVHSAAARENPDRHAESRPASLWVALGAIAVSFIGANFYGATKGVKAEGPVNYNIYGASYDPTTPPSPIPDGGGEIPMSKIGEKVYKGKCAACHQANGLGVPGTYPPLDGSEWVTGSTERLAALVGYGLSGPITVKGATYGVAVMPPHGPPVLNQKEFAAVLTYIRSAWSNTASEVSVEGVADFFQRTAGTTAMFTEAKLKEIPDDKMLIGGAAPAAGGDATPPPPGPAGAPGAPAPQPTNPAQENPKK